MHDEQGNSVEETKSKQYRMLAIVIGIALAVLSGFFYLLNSSPVVKNEEKLESAPFSSPVSAVDSKSALIDLIQKEMKTQKNQTEELKQALEAIKEESKGSQENMEMQSLKVQVETLQQALSERDKVKIEGIPGGAQSQDALFPSLPSENVASFSHEAKGIDNGTLHLKPKSDKPLKNPDTFVPAGTFAQAIMLGAADASAGVQSQSNPSPMLFRITAPGTLPNKKESHLTDCVVTAAVVGDISSERGQIRLERMSCTFPTGEIVEQPVEGTVFGMDAKNGVRGKPVWREGALLGRAAIAGTVSGIGSAISQTFTSQSISPLGSVETVNNNDIFKYGAAQGASNAMEKLAEYNIRRAEQYHPVIQLSAGQEVDVVFLKGFFLDGKSHEEVAQEKTQPTSLFPEQSAMTSTGLTLSEEELAKINQYEKSQKSWSQSRSGGVQ